jgi:protein TonB
MSRLYLAFFLALSLHLLLSVLPWPQENPPVVQPADNRSITVNLSQASAVVKKSDPPQMVPPRPPPTPIIPGRAVPVAEPIRPIPEKAKTPELLRPETKKKVMARQATAPTASSRVAAKAPARPAAASPAAAAPAKEIPQARRQVNSQVTPEPSLSIIKARPLYDQNPKPPYPALARRRGWQGVVILAVTVLADGSPGQLAIHTSSGHDLLDKTALQTVKRWHFLPGTKNNIAAPMKVLVPVRFVLQ